MIVRLLNEAQYRIDDGLLEQLNEIDNRAADAVSRDDEAEFRRELEQLAQTVRDAGKRLDDGDLSPSDLMIPPTDLTLEEARELFSGEGLIPDFPVPEGAAGS